MRWNWNEEEYHWDNITRRLLTELENNQNMFSGYYFNQEPYISVAIPKPPVEIVPWEFRVPRGTLCDFLYHSLTWMDESFKLYDSQTGRQVSPEMPITKSLQLVIICTETKSAEESSFLKGIRKRFDVVVGGVVVFVLIFGYMLGKKVV